MVETGSRRRGDLAVLGGGGVVGGCVVWACWMMMMMKMWCLVGLQVLVSDDEQDAVSTDPEELLDSDDSEGMSGDEEDMFRSLLARAGFHLSYGDNPPLLLDPSQLQMTLREKLVMDAGAVAAFLTGTLREKGEWFGCGVSFFGRAGLRWHPVVVRAGDVDECEDADVLGRAWSWREKLQGEVVVVREML